MQAVSFGDINGDGVLEVVFATASGAVHALSGISGHDVAPFPFRTRGRITAPVLLVKLRDAGRALHAVVQSSDGHLYAVDGISGAETYNDAGNPKLKNTQIPKILVPWQLSSLIDTCPDPHLEHFLLQADSFAARYHDFGHHQHQSLHPRTTHCAAHCGTMYSCLVLTTDLRASRQCCTVPVVEQARNTMGQFVYGMRRP